MPVKYRIKRSAIRRKTSTKGKGYFRKRYAITRPRKYLATNYRTINSYRFVRETLPQQIAPTIISGTGTQANIGYFQFSDIFMSSLPNWSEFKNLFARFKVSCIVSTLIPMAMETTSISDQSNTELALSANAKITRVNTKFLAKDFQVKDTAEEQLKELAQIQAKSVSLYTRKKPLTLVSKKPGQYIITLEDPDDQDSGITTRASGKWQNTGDGEALKFAHNNILFLEKLDGSDMSGNFGRYYITHKIYFSVSQVG